MKGYLVTWSMPIEAEDAVEAVQQAAEILRDLDNIATYFTIMNTKTQVSRLIDCEQVLYPERFIEVQMNKVDELVEKLRVAAQEESKVPEGHELCDRSLRHYSCTRKMGHQGSHIALGYKKMYIVWHPGVGE